jgi:plasmid maintenance system antidote protein VapI
MSHPDIRKSIIKAMEREGITANALAVRVAADVSRSLVYDFVAGKHDLTTEKANALLAAVGLEVVRKR